MTAVIAGGMKCPECGAWTIVKETRTRQDNTRRRRFECANMHKFTTVERVEKVKQGGYRPRKGERDADTTTVKRAGKGV